MTLLIRIASKRAALAAILLASAAPAFAQQADKMMTPTPTMSDGKVMTDKTMSDKTMTDMAMPASNMSGNMMETAKPAGAAPMMDGAKAMSDEKMMNDTKK